MARLGNRFSLNNGFELEVGTLLLHICICLFEEGNLSCQTFSFK